MTNVRRAGRHRFQYPIPGDAKRSWSRLFVWSQELPHALCSLQHLRADLALRDHRVRQTSSGTSVFLAICSFLHLILEQGLLCLERPGPLR